MGHILLPADQEDPLVHPDVRVLHGRKRILPHSALLGAFAARCDQPCALHWMPFFLNGRGRWWKRPSLVLVLKPGTAVAQLQVDDLAGAALFFEYRPLGLRTWTAVNDDVVAPAGQKSMIAGIAAEAMLEQGAHTVVASYYEDDLDPNEPWKALSPSGNQWVQRSRQMRRQMQLGKNYAETLGRLGKSTRTNMRYYSKRFQAKVPFAYIADARGVLTEADMLALNEQSLNPVEKSSCRLRYQASCEGEGFLVGIRSLGGEWLSAIGGWRRGSTTVVHWQVNKAGYQKDSLVTVMRACLLDGEAARGTQRLMYYGGTSHSMQNSFDEEVVWDFFVRRRSRRAAVLHMLSRFVETPDGFTRRTNFLASGLRNPELRWNTATASVRLRPEPPCVYGLHGSPIAGAVHGGDRSRTSIETE
jgi:hypothetical protein